MVCFKVFKLYSTETFQDGKPLLTNLAGDNDTPTIISTSASATYLEIVKEVSKRKNLPQQVMSFKVLTQI